jgi:hypothetical protein
VAAKEPFQVDLADLDSVRAKIPEVRKTVESKREQVRVAQRDFAYWNQLLERLLMLAGEKRDKATHTNAKPAKANAVESVVKALDESAVPLRAADLAGRVEQPLERKTLAWALWKAARDNRIQRIETGLYAPLDYEPEQEELVES